MKYAVLAIALALALFSGASAFAQATDTTIRVDSIIGPWMEMIASAVSIIIGAGVIYISSWVRTKFGIDVEARHRESLQAALNNGAGLILSKIGTTIGDKSIDVKNPMIKYGIEYVIDAAPDAVRKFGLTPDQLAEKLVAKLGLATAPAAVVEHETTQPVGFRPV